MCYNNETKYKLKLIKIVIVIMITIMIIIIEKDLTSSCNQARLIFDNVSKQLRFKNSARSINAFPFLLQSLFTIIIIIWIYFINSIKYYFKVSSVLLHSLNFFVYLLFTILS